MTEIFPDSDLPTPAQMQNVRAAEQATFHARRMREASHGFVTGAMACGGCSIGTTLVVINAPWMGAEWIGSSAMLIAIGLLFGSLALFGISILWILRNRQKSHVVVRNLWEENIPTAIPAGRKKVFFFAVFAVQLIFMTGWMVTFRYLPDVGIIAALAMGPLVIAGFFIVRFVRFRFWEDLIFAACVILAFAPLLFRAGFAFTFLPFPLVAIATVSLHTRWTRWVRSLESEVGHG